MDNKKQKNKNSVLTESIKSGGIERFGKQLLKSFEELGLGVLSKSDFETFMYHILTEEIDKEKIRNNYDWMRVLKVTPAKLRALQLNQSAKYQSLNLDLDESWEILYDHFKNKLFNSNLNEGNMRVEYAGGSKIKFLVDNLHVYRLIERYCYDNGSSLDYKRNMDQVVMEFDLFLNLFTKILIVNKKKEKAKKLQKLVDNKIRECSMKDKLSSKEKRTLDSLKAMHDIEKVDWTAKGIDLGSSIVSNIISSLISGSIGL